MNKPFRMGGPLTFASGETENEMMAQALEDAKLRQLLDFVGGFHFTQPNSVAYFDIAPNVHVHSPGYPNRWFRFWQRLLLGWRWRRL